MAQGEHRCPKCSRTFGMAAHLARHLSGGHNIKPKGAAKNGRKKRKKGGRKPGVIPVNGRRRVGGRKRALGRPVGSGRRLVGGASRASLKAMDLEQLRVLIDAAKEEARRKLVELQAAFD